MPISLSTIVLLMSAMGCGKTGYYVASYEYSKTYHSASENHVQQFDEEIGRLLRRDGAKIAFYPPDRCFDAPATPSGDVRTQEFLELTCGDMMSELERAALLAGYRVVSWQGLKTRDSNPLDRARSLGINMLFEINALTTNLGQEGSEAVTDIGFHEQLSEVERTPVVVDDAHAVGLRCLDNPSWTAGPNIQDSATLSVKLVSTKDGQALWYYHKTIGDDAEHADYHRDVYFEAGAEGGHGVGPMRVAGGVLGGLALLTTMIAVDGDTPVLLPVGLLLGLGAGGAFVGAGVLQGNAPLEPPDNVLCRGQGLLYNPYLGPIDAPKPEAVSSEGSGFRVSSSMNATRDRVLDRRKELIENVVEDFITELGKL